MTDPQVLAAARARGVTRLCHFTPSLNLPHILRDGMIRPTSELSADVRSCFSPTDLDRLDGHPDCISCSIEFPNVHYLVRARQRGRLVHFPSWVVFILNLELLGRAGALFCPRNAAAGSGAYLKPGLEGLEACYAPAVSGAGGYVFSRGSTHLPPCPTDEQAEVLLPGPVGFEHIEAIVVADETQAKSELAALRIAGLSLPGTQVRIASALFNRSALSSHIRSGQRPTEDVWTHGDTHG